MKTREYHEVHRYHPVHLNGKFKRFIYVGCYSMFFDEGSRKDVDARTEGVLHHSSDDEQRSPGSGERDGRD